MFFFRKKYGKERGEREEKISYTCVFGYYFLKNFVSGGIRWMGKLDIEAVRVDNIGVIMIVGRRKFYCSL